MIKPAPPVRSLQAPNTPCHDDLLSFSELQTMISQLKMVMALPEIIRASIQNAQIPGRAGFKDREMLLMMGGLLQKNSQVNVSTSVSISKTPKLDSLSPK